MKQHLYSTNQLPDFVRAEYPKFTTFVEHYYRWLNEEYSIGDYKDLVDLDSTVDQFLVYFKKQYDVFSILSKSNNKFYLRKLKELYSAKGSEDAVEFFFRLAYSKEASVRLPWDDVLKVSDGKWFQETGAIVRFTSEPLITRISTKISELTPGVLYTVDDIGSSNFMEVGAISNSQGVEFIATGPGEGTGVASRQLGTFVEPFTRTADQLTQGIVYTITSSGSSDFTLVGADNNNVGTEFVATGPTVGTGTVRQLIEGQFVYIIDENGVKYKTSVTKLAPRANNVFEITIEKFQCGRVRFVRVESLDGSVYGDILLTTMTAVVERSGKGFREGQIFAIEGTDGSRSVLKVKKVGKQGEILSIEIFAYGYEFDKNFNIILAPNNEPVELGPNIGLGIFEGAVDPPPSPIPVNFRYLTDDKVNTQNERGIVIRHDYTIVSGEIPITDIVPGSLYIISSVGNSDFREIGAFTNTFNEIFVATKVGTGTGMVLQLGATTIPATSAIHGINYRIEDVGSTNFGLAGGPSWPALNRFVVVPAENIDTSTSEFTVYDNLNHGFNTGDYVRYNSSGSTSASNLEYNSSYYIVKISNTKFKLSATYENAFADPPVTIDIPDEGQSHHIFVLDSGIDLALVVTYENVTNSPYPNTISFYGYTELQTGDRVFYSKNDNDFDEIYSYETENLYYPINGLEYGNIYYLIKHPNSTGKDVYFYLAKTYEDALNNNFIQLAGYPNPPWPSWFKNFDYLVPIPDYKNTVFKTTFPIPEINPLNGTGIVRQIFYDYGETFPAANIIPGKLYEIVSTGTTNFTLAGAPTNTVGTWFISSGLSSGTGIVRQLKFISHIIDLTYVGNVAARLIAKQGFPATQEQLAFVRLNVGCLYKYPGFYLKSDSILGDSAYLQDSNFYQIYSYLVTVSELIKTYGDALKKALHPAGTKVFGNYDLSSQFNIDAAISTDLNYIDRRGKFIDFASVSEEIFKDITRVMAETFTIDTSKRDRIVFCGDPIQREFGTECALVDRFTETLSANNQFNGSSSSAVLIADDTFFVVGHGLFTGNSVVYYSGGGTGIGTSQGNLVTGQKYYAIRTNENRFRIALTASDAANNIYLTLTALGTGSNHYFVPEEITFRILDEDSNKYLSDTAAASSRGFLYKEPVYVELPIPQYWEAGYLEEERTFT